MNNIKNVDPGTWSVKDVSMFLNFCGLDKFIKTFVDNDIDGAGLLDLTDHDLASMGITVLGQKKTILKNISLLKSNPKGFFTNEGADDSSSVSSSSDARTSGKDYSFKILYKNNFVMMSLSPEKVKSYSKFKKAVKKAVKSNVDVWYEDSDKDKIAIRKTSHLDNMIKVSSGTIKIIAEDVKDEVKDEGVITSIPQTEKTLLDGMLDAIVVINQVGTILYWGKLSEQLFGFSSSEMVGKNITTIMPETDAKSHGYYLYRYMTSRDAHVVGKAPRPVIARHKDGSSVSVTLAVQETRYGEKSTFMGILRPNTMKTPSETNISSAVSYSILNNIPSPVVVLDANLTIAFANKNITTAFGWDKMDLLMKKANFIFDESAKIVHDEKVKIKCKNGPSVNYKLEIQNNVFPKVVILIPASSIVESLSEQIKEDVAMVETLLVPAAMIDKRGIILAYNEQLVQLLGFSKDETIGKNVNMLMPSPDKERHNSYLSRYHKTGKSTVIGTGRDVIAQHKDGKMIPVHLSVMKKESENDSYFIGLFDVV